MIPDPNKVKESGIEIDMVAPDHGLIWRSHIADILQSYEVGLAQGRRKGPGDL